ncbi:hypothetical protein Tco_0861709 [Tanacetum coccineum]|uniref:Uncharacterized protein n=1 Tax=Tanacetum coccineum TaxID=301880 RepID=A0ABQ5BLJ6_9ASTR
MINAAVANALLNFTAALRNSVPMTSGNGLGPSGGGGGACVAGCAAPYTSRRCWEELALLDPVFVHRWGQSVHRSLFVKRTEKGWEPCVIDLRDLVIIQLRRRHLIMDPSKGCSYTKWPRPILRLALPLTQQMRKSVRSFCCGRMSVRKGFEGIGNGRLCLLRYSTLHQSSGGFQIYSDASYVVTWFWWLLGENVEAATSLEVGLMTGSSLFSILLFIQTAWDTDFYCVPTEIRVYVPSFLEKDYRKKAWETRLSQYSISSSNRWSVREGPFRLFGKICLRACALNGQVVGMIHLWTWKMPSTFLLDGSRFKPDMSLSEEPGIHFWSSFTERVMRISKSYSFCEDSLKKNQP